MYERTRPPVSVVRGVLPPGDAGSLWTLAMMRRFAQEGAKMVPVRETAVNILRSAGVAPHDIRGQVGAIFRWVRDRIYFVNDPPGEQVIQGVPYTLEHRFGNCTQRAILLAALLGSIGIPTTFRAIGADPRFPSSFSHVYVAALVGKERIPLDPTYSDNTMGWQYPEPTRFVEVPA